MKVEYGKGPMYYINGVPGYKAGEWPGIKSCKFGATRRVIRPVCCGIIFNENEPPLIPRRKLLGPKPSPEYIFRPCLKMVKPLGEQANKAEGLRYINFHPIPIKETNERKHVFKYKEEYEKQEAEKQKTMNVAKYVRNEFQLLENIGFKKKFYNELPNSKLLGLTFTKDKFNNMTMNYKDPFEMKQIQREKRAQALIEKQELKKDIDYVHNLKYEKKILPKLETKVQQQPSVQQQIEKAKDKPIEKAVPQTSQKKSKK